MSIPPSPTGLLRRWLLRHHEHARANARAAATALSGQRLQRAEVEAYLLDHRAEPARPVGTRPA